MTSSYFSLKPHYWLWSLRKPKSPLIHGVWGWDKPPPRISLIFLQVSAQAHSSSLPPHPLLSIHKVEGDLWSASLWSWRKTAIFACLCTRFVFLISFYLKVYQLLYYQSEASLQSLFFFLSPSAPLLFVPRDNQCLWSQLPLLIFHYSLI